jgi:ribose transport system ATP-binding protein
VSAAALDMARVSKRFGGVVALDDMELSLEPGEVHALLGQNGCGKSTLVKILAGYHSPDTGAEVRVWGEDVSLPMADPDAHGIAVIHQDLGVAPEMSVADNVGVSLSYGTKALLPIHTQAEHQRTRSVLDDIGLDVPLSRHLSGLSPAERAGVAIARSTRVLGEQRSPHLFILDEPTTYLNRDEAAKVIALMRGVASRGSSVLFISHRLNEIMEVADRVTVMRDGRRVTVTRPADTSRKALITAMLGREFASFYPDPPAAPPGDALLEVDGLVGRRVGGIDLRAHEGEIVGVAGLAGMGQEELPYLLAGAAPIHAGDVRVQGRSTVKHTPPDLIRMGVALVPGNRQRDGGWQLATAQENITLPVLRAYFRRGWLRPGAERRACAELMERFGVRPPHPQLSLGSFSGGNQQKLVLAQWLSMQPRVLLLDEPTQGVDAEAKREILGLVVAAAEQGATVLLCSGDYEQLAHVCNRVLVLHDGAVGATLSGDDLTEEAIAVAVHQT